MFNIEPRIEVDEKWALTFEWCQSFLSTTATLSTIIEELPTLKQAFGHELVIIQYIKTKIGVIFRLLQTTKRYIPRTVKPLLQNGKNLKRWLSHYFCPKFKESRG